MRVLVFALLSLALLANVDAAVSPFGKEFTGVIEGCVKDAKSCRKLSTQLAKKFPVDTKRDPCADPKAFVLGEDKQLFDTAVKSVTQFVSTHYKGAGARLQAALTLVKQISAFAAKPTKESCVAVKAAIGKATQGTTKLLSSQQLAALTKEDAEGLPAPAEKEQEPGNRKNENNKAQQNKNPQAQRRGGRFAQMDDEAEADEMLELVANLPMGRKLLAVNMHPVGAGLPAIPWYHLRVWWNIYLGPAWVYHFPLGEMTIPNAFRAQDALFTGVAGTPGNAHVGLHHIKPNFNALCNQRACARNGKFSAFTSWADASNAMRPWYEGGIYKLANYDFYTGAAAAAGNRAGAHYNPPAKQAPAIECHRAKAAVIPKYKAAVKCASGHYCHCRSAPPVKIGTIVKLDLGSGDTFVLTHFPYLP